MASGRKRHFDLPSVMVDWRLVTGVAVTEKMAVSARKASEYCMITSGK